MEGRFTYKERIEIVRNCLISGQDEDARMFDNPIEYGYTLACKQALRLIDKYLVDYPADDKVYPLGKNDYQE